MYIGCSIIEYEPHQVFHQQECLRLRPLGLPRPQAGERAEEEGHQEDHHVRGSAFRISSIDKDIVKVLLKMMDTLPKGHNPDHKKKLMDYAQTILDKDKQNELDAEL